MLTIILGFFKRYYVTVIGVLVVMGALFWLHHSIYQQGYTDGSQKVQAAWNEQKAEQTAAVARAVSEAKAVGEANVRAAIAATEQESQQQQAIHTVFHTINTKVAQYAKTPGGSTTCLDADRLRLWNAANAGSDGGGSGSTGDDSGESSVGVPGFTASR